MTIYLTFHAHFLNKAFFNVHLYITPVLYLHLFVTPVSHALVLDNRYSHINNLKASKGDPFFANTPNATGNIKPCEYLPNQVTRYSIRNVMSYSRERRL